MNIYEIKNSVQENYDLNIIGIEKIKNVYRIKTLKGDYCLKVIKYSFDHFLFILNAIKHLQDRGFERTPQILKRKDGLEYLNLQGSHAYLTPWINARECNYDNPVDIILATSKLADLHNKSEHFEVTDSMRPRVGWFRWIENYKTRRDEILDFKKRIEAKTVTTEFDYIYLDAMEEELQRAEISIENLGNSEYIQRMRRQIENKGFCHHDYAHHNVLIENDSTVNIIDFDYCILDSNLHDLSSIMLRVMKNGKWDINNAVFIMDAYNNVRRIEKVDIPIMAAFMEFPQDYWQVGIQYYWEKQPWDEDFFIKRLKKNLEDKEEKQEFIEEFRGYKYKR